MVSNVLETPCFGENKRAQVELYKIFFFEVLFLVVCLVI